MTEQKQYTIEELKERLAEKEAEFFKMMAEYEDKSNKAWLHIKTIQIKIDNLKPKETVTL
jgi:ribosomal protein L29